MRTVACPSLLVPVFLLMLPMACSGADLSRVEVPPQTAAGEVPLRLVGPNGTAVVVGVEVAGQGPFDFAVDTGATFTCVDERLAKRLGLEDVRGLVTGGVGVGGAGRVRMVRLGSLAIGATRVDDVLGCAIDLEPFNTMPGVEVQGLLGLNVLKAFTVTLDFDRSVLRLEPARGAARRDAGGPR